MNRYTIRSFKYGDTDCPMSKLQDLENKIEDKEIVEVKHGEWKISSDGYYPYCNNCKTEPKNGVLSKFCPECGAKMDGERSEGNENH